MFPCFRTLQGFKIAFHPLSSHPNLAIRSRMCIFANMNKKNDFTTDYSFDFAFMQPKKIA